MSVATVRDIQRYLALYGQSILPILGNVGNLFAMVIFARKTIRQAVNSCVLYLLADSISNCIVMNIILISNLYAIDHLDPQNQFDAVCKARWYSTHVLLMLSRSFMIAACIDRWALCSVNVNIRSFSRPKIAHWIILGLIIFWSLAAIHLGVFFTNSSGRCKPSSNYAFFYAIYSMIVIGLLPLFLMILFSVLAWRNLQSIRSRVTPTGNAIGVHRIHQSDRDLMRMLAGEVIVFVITTLPYPVNGLYGVLTGSIAAQKSEMRLAIESLLSFIVTALLILMYCMSQFYVCMICSKKFRKEFIDLFCCPRVVNEAIRPNAQPITRTRQY